MHGRSAEWVVEVPSQSPHMPIFSPVTFTDCTAGSARHGLFNLTGGYPSDIRTPSTSTSPQGSPATKTTVTSATTAVVEELKLDWFCNSLSRSELEVLGPELLTRDHALRSIRA